MGKIPMPPALKVSRGCAADASTRDRPSGLGAEHSPSRDETPDPRAGSYPSPHCSPARIVHLDGDPVWREVFGLALSVAMPRAHVYVARSTTQALELCRRFVPTVVVVELLIHGDDGFDFLRALAAWAQGPRVLAFTARHDDLILHRAQSGWLDGLIWKTTAAAAHLRIALPILGDGGRFFPSEVRERMAAFSAAPDAFFKIISPAEQELLPWFGRGLSDAEVAVLVGRKAGTIKWHRHEIMKKLGFSRAIELAFWAMEKGFCVSKLPLPPCLWG